jgi:glycine cleavage system H lipoate-binding protein
MEGFTYVDIFATKGIEYLLVIGFLMIIVLYWRFLTTPAKRVQIRISKTLPSLTEWFHIPENLYYHQGHTWAVPEDKEVIKIGVDDFASKLFGSVTSVKLPPAGSKVYQGEPALKVIIDGKEIPLLSPVNGEVVAFNEELLKNPEKINNDPYKDGWLLKIKTPRLSADIKNLFSGRMAKAWMDTTLKRLREVSGGDLGLVYQDGGFPINGIAKIISPQEWDKVVREFLLV